MTLEGISAIVDFLSAELPTDRRVLVGIDGVDGSGKTTFANAIAESFSYRPTVLIHLDDFLNVSKIRHRRGRDSPEGFWLDSYDYESLTRNVVEPLLPSGTGVYCRSSFDPSIDKAIQPALHQCAADAVVIVEGMFLHRDELTGAWDFSLFLDVPFDERPGEWQSGTDRSRTRNTRRCSATLTANACTSPRHAPGSGQTSSSTILLPSCRRSSPQRKAPLSGSRPLQRDGHVVSPNRGNVSGRMW